MMPFIGAAGYYRHALAMASSDDGAWGREGLLRLVRDGVEVRRGGINFTVQPNRRGPTYRLGPRSLVVLVGR